ncbi:sensor histidine kinase [Devosia sp.]|uniref:sensor histidine kinase n=1 Tax=Devosia sp. TaxID=1871048 RepID=UPI002F006CFA
MTDIAGSFVAAVQASIANTSRRDVLAGLNVLDTEDDADFDRLVRLTATMAGAPVGMVSLVDADREWYKARHGLQLRETPIASSLCAHAIADVGSPALVIGDAGADSRFAASILVVAPPNIRFFAAAPITVRGQRIGALAVASPEPRLAAEATLTEQLIALADTAASLFVLKDEARIRARTAADLMKEEWRHALTLEAGRVGSWVWDLRSDDVVANDIMRRMFSLPPARPVSIDDFFAAIVPGEREAVRAALEASFEQGVDYVSEFSVASGRWLAGRGRVYQRDAAGRPLVMMGVCIDITEAREAADHTRLLLRELNHRVKNTLAMIQSLARQTLSHAADPQSFIEAFSGRLRTLSEAHVLLADRDWGSIGLVELITAQLGPDLIAEPARLSLQGEDVPLPPDQALGLGLIVHELLTNAMKFGALSTPQGHVDIAWRREAGPRPLLNLSWRESGGPAVRPPVEAGFGTRLIQRSLDKIVDSRVRIEYPASGVEVRVKLPLG